MSEDVFEGGDGKEDDEEEISKVSFLDMLKLNIPDWHIIIPGIIGSALIGVLLPCVSILLSEALQVSVVKRKSLLCIGMSLILKDSKHLLPTISL